MVKVEYFIFNYKDGLCLLVKGGGLVCNYLYVLGIDFVGMVEVLDNLKFVKGDKVVLIGWCVGEVYWGGYVEYVCVKGDWLVLLFDGLIL